MFETGQKFRMRSKLDRNFREFIYLGIDAAHFDQNCNHMIKEVATGEVSHIHHRNSLTRPTRVFSRPRIDSETR